MNKELVQNLLKYLQHQGKGGWAILLAELITEHENEVTLNRELQDNLAKMHKLYQDLKDERRRAPTA